MMKSMKKLVLAGVALLAVMMVILPLVSCDTNAGGGSVTNTDTTGGNTSGNTDNEPFLLKDSDGDGYYEISTAEELYAFAAIVNEGKPLSDKGKPLSDSSNLFLDVELTADIVVNENVLVVDENGWITSSDQDFRVWTPIGNIDKEYLGTFDGAGHTISGLYFSYWNQDYVGLFGYIGSQATVKNVGILDSYLSGDEYVGGVVGASYWDCNVTNCYNTGYVSGLNYVGGVMGSNLGNVTNCYNTGEVSALEGIAGGVVGHNNRDSSVTNCYNTGDVIGGTDNVGGVVGSGEGNVTNCYYLSGTAEGGINGTDNDGAIAKTAEEFASSDMATLLNTDQEDKPWEFISGKPAPTLIAFNKN